MVVGLYNFILILSALVLLPYYLLRGIKYGKSRRGVRERLGYYSPDLLAALQGHSIIWIHAVSVGETRAARPLIDKLRTEYPDSKILLSNVTETGHAIAQNDSAIDFCLFFPFDFSWSVRRALELVRPRLIIIVETEIWPNFCRHAHRQGIPLLLVNGRLSDRSYPRYRRLRWLLKPLLQCFSGFCMQSQQDNDRIAALGANPRIVENTGNLKFDHQLLDVDKVRLAELKKNYRLPDKAAVLVAGSTHDGEEQHLLDVYPRIAAALERPLVLVLVPRHPERSREIAAIAKTHGIGYRLRSQLDSAGPLFNPGELLLVDTLGEMLDLYAVADLVFVGGSLVHVGGHNMLEAALVSRAVLFGPHVQNFKEISAKLIRAGAGLKVRNPLELERQCIRLLNDPARCRVMGEAGRNLIAENAGAAERTMRHVRRLLVD